MYQSLKSFLLMAVAASSLLARGPSANLVKGPYRGAVVGDFLILVPATAQQKKKGLRSVPSIPAKRGMVLFQKGRGMAVMTTRDCPIAMDLVFIAPDGAIQNVVKAQAIDLVAARAKHLRYMALGACTKDDLPDLVPEIPPTAFVVAVGAGEGARFARAWRAEMTDVFVYADLTNPVPGF